MLDAFRRYIDITDVVEAHLVKHCGTVHAYTNTVICYMHQLDQAYTNTMALYQYYGTVHMYTNTMALYVHTVH